MRCTHIHPAALSRTLLLPLAAFVVAALSPATGAQTVQLVDTLTLSAGADVVPDEGPDLEFSLRYDGLLGLARQAILEGIVEASDRSQPGVSVASDLVAEVDRSRHVVMHDDQGGLDFTIVDYEIGAEDITIRFDPHDRRTRDVLQRIVDTPQELLFGGGSFLSAGGTLFGSALLWWAVFIVAIVVAICLFLCWALL